MPPNARYCLVRLHSWPSIQSAYQRKIGYYIWGDELSSILNQLMAARSHERQLLRTLETSLGTIATLSDITRLVEAEKAAMK